MKYSIVIATFNRSGDLRATLQSLSALEPDGPWEVIVVDNNSTDDTRAVVQEAAGQFPVELTYVFEDRQGRSPETFPLSPGARVASLTASLSRAGDPLC